MGLAFYLHFLYSVPSLILYCLILYIIIRDRKELHGPYYIILRFSFILDVLSYVSNLMGVWILSFPMLNDFLLSLNNYPRFLNILLFVHKFLLHSQNMRCLICCIHRYTLIACPLKINQLWDKAILPMLCLVPIYGCLASSYIWFVEPYLYEANGEVYWEFAHPVIIFWPTIAMVGFYILGIAVPNMLTIRALTQHKRDTIAVRIWRVTVCCSILQTFNLFAMGSIGLSQTYHWNISQFIEINILPFTRDSYTFSYPWFNLFINRDVRRRILAILHLDSKQIGSVTLLEQAKTTALEPSSNKIIITLDNTEI